MHRDSNSIILGIGTILGVIISLVSFILALIYLQPIGDMIVISYLSPQGLTPTPQLSEPPQMPEKKPALSLPELHLSVKPALERPIHKQEKPDIKLPYCPPATLEQPSTATARIAIILDDAGYSISGASGILLDIDAPLTISILPGLKYSKEVAQRAYQSHKEVMLHMPMEYCQNSKTTKEDDLCRANRTNDSPYKWALLSGMSEAEVERQLLGAINDIPHLKGINNHMGSKATSDEKLMSVCMDKLKGKDLFFIDSLTSGKSVAYKLAKEKNIRAAKRQVFLDNKDSVEHVRAQMEILIKTAKKRGSAIGIGHVTKYSTALVLKEMIPRLREEGIEVVHASQLAN